MEEREPFSEQASIRLIHEMISLAKQEQQEDGSGWILWGWLLLVVSICSYLNQALGWAFYPYFFWIAFGILSSGYFIFLIIRFTFLKKRKGTKTYTTDLIQKLNLAFMVSVAFIVLALNLGSIGVVPGFALLINLYGIRTLIQGAALGSRPFVIGAWLCWALGFVGLFAQRYDQIMLIHAAAVLCGYIIPGHLANYSFKTKSGLLHSHKYRV